MKFIRLFSAALLWVSATAVYAADPTPAGVVTLLKGRVTVMQDGKAVSLYKGASVIVGDQLSTGKNARARLRMIDGMEIWLGGNTDFTVRDYHMGSESGAVSLQLVKGFFRAITGKITKMKQNTFELKTPVAVIGVRGTDFWGEQNPDLFRVALLGGSAIIVSNDAGSVEITEIGLGTEVTSPNKPPSTPTRWSDDTVKKAFGTVN